MQSHFLHLTAFVALRLIRSGTALHEEGIQPAAMTVPRNALAAAYQTEATLGVQGTAGSIVLQHGGLQGQ